MKFILNLIPAVLCKTIIESTTRSQDNCDKLYNNTISSRLSAAKSRLLITGYTTLLDTINGFDFIAESYYNSSIIDYQKIAKEIQKVCPNAFPEYDQGIKDKYI